jgi:hypothetical protein
MGGIEVVDAEQFYASTEGAQFYGVNARALAPRARVGALSANAVVPPAEDTPYADVLDASAAGASRTPPDGAQDRRATRQRTTMEPGVVPRGART